MTTNNIWSREAYKSGYLKHTTFGKTKSLNTLTRYWSVFNVVNDADPFLELYKEKPVGVLCDTVKPLYTFYLKNCLYVSPAIVVKPIDEQYEFTIGLPDQLVRLFAESRQSMDDWISSLRTKLKQINVLASESNFYAKDTNLPPPSRSSLTLTRPLPPIPATPARSLCTSSPNPSSGNAHRGSSTQAAISRQETCSTNDRASQLTTSGSLYEPIFDALTSNFTSSVSFDRENRSSSPSSSIDDVVSPPSYSDAARQNNPNTSANNTNNAGSVNGSGETSVPLSLRESQILRLQREISHKDGVRVVIRKKDCNESIAMVDWLGCVWIAGWKQKAYPQLHNTFHIGDKVMTVGGEMITNSSQAYKLIKMTPLVVEIVLRRVPHGFVFIVKRNFDGEDIGIVREGNTAEIVDIQDGGLASQAGLKPKATPIDTAKSSQCNWVITEINNRPLNLFFKNEEIKDRLNAVGKEISLLVQPADLVQILKKKLKSFKNYKEYIIQ